MRMFLFVFGIILVLIGVIGLVLTGFFGLPAYIPLVVGVILIVIGNKSRK